MSDPSPDQLQPARLRRAADRATWPLRRAAWALEERIFWAALDRIRDFRRPTQAVVATALVGAATLAGAADALLSPPETELAATAAIAPAASASTSTEPVAAAIETRSTDAPPLQGPSPNFEAAPRDRSDGVAPVDKAPSVGEAASTPPAPLTIDPSETPDFALKTAKRFAKAFVSYEIGRADARVGKAFRETATAPLVKALAQRPPRLPADVDVPKARVLNVVAGQRLGKTLSVSVALVRLGATSELRLQLDKTGTGWLISDVRG